MSATAVSEAFSYRLSAIGTANPNEFPLAKSEVLVGSGADNDLRIREASVSRRHAKIAREGDGFRVSDLQSTNGTFVNGVRITGSAIVRAGDEVRFGSVRYSLRNAVGGPRNAAAAQPAKAAATLPSVTPAAPPVSSPPRQKLRPATIAGIVALLFAISFVITEYVVSWNRIEDAAEYHTANAPTATSSAAVGSPILRSGAHAPPGAHSVTPPAPPVVSAADRAWLLPLNSYRSEVGLAPVSVDPALSAGDTAHSRYLVKNYEDSAKSKTLGAEAHEEDPSNRWYTAEGAKAAASSDITEGYREDGSAWLEPADAMAGWVSIPFHRLWLLNPNLHRAGYGQYCDNGFCVASLDVGNGADPVAGIARLANPMEFPSAGSVVTIRSADREWPDPLTACPGYALPMGLPITLQLGALLDAHVTAYSLARDGDASAPIEACAFDSSTYVNPDSVQQQRGREILHDFGAAVVIPREPLSPGRYTVSITAAGKPYTWSFTIAG